MISTRPSVPGTGKKTLGTDVLEVQEYYQHGLYSAAKECVTQSCTGYCSLVSRINFLSFPLKIILL